MQAVKKADLYFLLAFAGFCINFFTYSPGFMSGDTIDQLRQSIAGEFTTWHPPAMAYCWHMIGLIFGARPQPMLVFQLGLLWGSYYMLATTGKRKVWGFGLFIIFLLTPVIQNFAGYIIKDTQMAMSWLFATSVLLKHAITREKMPVKWIIITALLLAYGTWVRHNAIPGLVTLCMIWSWIAFEHRAKTARILTGTGLFITIIVSGKILDAIIKPRVDYPETILYMHDLSALYVATGDAVFPASVYADPDFDTAYIHEKFHPAVYDHIVWNSDSKHIVKFEPARVKELKKAWVSAIQKHPLQYLKNRWETFLYFLRIKNHSGIIYFHPYIADNEFGYKVKTDRPLYDFFFRLMNKQKHAFYFNTWFWVAINLLLFAGVLLLRNRQHKFYYTCMLISGLFYVLPYFALITNDGDFRYVYWLCLSSIVAVIFLIASRNSDKYTLPQSRDIR